MDFDLEKLPGSTAYKLLVGLVAPRPIALVTSVSRAGRLNAAPFSAYNYLSTDPPIVGIGIALRPDGQMKDTARNIRETGEFVINVVTEDVAEAMNVCAIDFPPEIDETLEAELSVSHSSVVKVPRLAQAHAALECREHATLAVGRTTIILGQVVAAYVEDRFVDPSGPYVKAEQLHAIGRMNGLGNYVSTRNAFFSIPRIALKDWKPKKDEPA